MDEKLYQEVLQGCLECIRAWKEEKGGVLPIQWGDYVTHCWNYGGSDLHNAIDALVAGLDDDSEAEIIRPIERRLLIENLGEEQAECVYIGRRVAELRAEKDMTQQQLADLTGISREHVARIEAGKYSVGLKHLAKIAAALGMTIDFVSTGE